MEDRSVAAAPVPRAAARSATGATYVVDPGESLLTVRVYRAGPLAALGHNHVIACHGLEGRAVVPANPLEARVELRVPVDALTVDETALRAAEHSADFPPDLPEDARTGTRRNMLSPAVLDAAAHPVIELRVAGLEVTAHPGEFLARIEARVRDHASTLRVPVRYRLEPATLHASGEVALRQSELGLTPLTIFMGALQVQDEMQVAFTLSAHRQAPPPG